MGYQLSLEQFQNSKMFDSKGKLYHKSGNRFKLFPFVTQPNSIPVTELGPLIGSFLCRVEEKKPKEITAAELVEKLKEDTEIQAGQEELFFETIRQLFFTTDGSLRPMNLQMIEHMTCTETSQNRIAEYLVDVLGSTEALKKSLDLAKNKNSSNVLEAFVLSKHEFDDSLPGIYQDVTGKEFADPEWVGSEAFRKEEWDILREVCADLYPDEELAFEMMYSLVDIENKATSLNQRKGILDELEACITHTFYKNEDDATSYYQNRISRKKDLGGKYNEKFFAHIQEEGDEFMDNEGTDVDVTAGGGEE